jgi:hypothetical protein
MYLVEINPAADSEAADSEAADMAHYLIFYYEVRK